jgi:conjugal transfer pilus assembly protein TrbC
MLYLLPMKSFAIVLILALGKGLTPAVAEDAAFYELNDVSAIMEKAEEDAKTMNLPMNKYSEKGLKAAKQTTEIFYSPEFQEKVKCEQQRLEREVFANYIAPWKKKKQQMEKVLKGSLSSAEKVYLLFSSSVPDATIQTYIATIVKAGDSNIVPVMRGWVSSMAGTQVNAEYFSRILKKDPTCRNTKEPCQHYQVGIKLKPTLFTKYGITRVPAVVYENDKDAYLIQGDAGLDYLLEKINREAKSSTLTSLIKKMRGAH